MQHDPSKTFQELIEENALLKQRIQVLEKSESERKQAQDALRESESLFHSLIDYMHDAMLILNWDGEILFANRAAAKIMDIEQPEEFVGHNMVEYLHPDSFQKAAEDLEAVKADKMGFLSEYQLYSVTGRHIWVESIGGKIVYRNATANLVCIRDITKRRRAEEALRESEEKHKSLLKNIPDIIFTIDLEGKITFVSQRTKEILGYENEETITMNILNFIPEEDHQRAMENLQEGIKGKKIKHFQIPMIAKSGERLFFECSFSRVYKGGALVGVQGTAVDITDRKRAEEALRESEEKNRVLFEDGPIETLVTDLEGRIIQYNKAFERSGEKGSRRLPEIGSKMYIDYASHHSIDMRTELIDCINSKTPKTYNEIPYKSKFLNIKMVPTREGAIISTIDITDRKQAEEQLHASLREKDILLSEVHHRVKNNMQVISSLLDLQARSTENPELTEKLNESKSQIRSMAMIHEKLYNSKDFTKIDLDGYVRALSQELFQSYKINPRKIDLIIQTDGDISVDINKAIPCGLILNELISNALKHAFPGDRQGKLQIIMGETKNTEIEIVVRDNGMGLPDDVDIHEPQTTGLYLVNGLVKNQIDGQIEVRRDTGTEFRIKFPL